MFRLAWCDNCPVLVLQALGCLTENMAEKLSAFTSSANIGAGHVSCPFVKGPGLSFEYLYIYNMNASVFWRREEQNTLELCETQVLMGT